MPAIGLQDPPILNEPFHRPFIDRNIEQSVASDIKRDRFARSKRDSAEIGADQTTVIDMRAKQRDITAVRSDRAVVDDRSAAAGKAVMPAHEVCVGYVER